MAVFFHAKKSVTIGVPRALREPVVAQIESHHGQQRQHREQHHGKSLPVGGKSHGIVEQDLLYRYDFTLDIETHREIEAYVT